MIGIGAEYSTLNQDLLDVAASESLSISKVPQEYFYEAENINRSDQYAFMKAGIPSLLVMEGVHYRHTPYRAGIKRMIDWNKSVYHTPFDDLSQDINFQAAVQHTQFIYQLILHVLDNPEVPQWHEGVPFINARLQSNAEKR